MAILIQDNLLIFIVSNDKFIGIGVLKMQKGFLNPSLMHEEQRALKWFLIMFYLISVVYDLFYYVIFKKYVYNLEPGLPGFGYVYYVLLFALLPLLYLLSKKGKVTSIKYIFIFLFLLLSTINDAVYYLGKNLSDTQIGTGNVVEVFVILFTPMFVNRRFFHFVFLGMVLKYLVIWGLLQSNTVLLPLILYLFVSGIAYVLLKRFQSYLQAFKTSYDEQLRGIVKGVIATIELKDPYTRGHSERVAQYARSLAVATGNYNEDELNSFHYACLLHDIGKVNIPDQILMKPGRLTSEEFEVIKTHPVVGVEAVKKVQGLDQSLDVIKSHHERWDGKGYPDQLKEEEISQLARIVSIADAFDAMTSSRSYRSALPVDEAYKRIIEGKGTQFDPSLVELFQKVYPQWVKFHEEYDWSMNLSYQNE
ncbi:HD-GYP domain-containing protein [Mesobacillus maritimus]|uniref:HD-GYP domain-containing protein n=1 Tax=Mesobacillus maritimus TaxID=1643336 RepID=UPI002040DC35|nr:HD-GYP domain-containing protein [Mesobacillus maritimus]MCM3585504.1 HD-GYP domain-containing protein [Mesobacillus maritimus]